MKRSMSEFTGMYQVPETLTFELKPIGKTEENLKKSGLLEQDFKRAEDYPEVKKFLDEQHKQFLQKVLEDITDIDWHDLAQKITEFQKDGELKSELEKLQAAYRKKIADKFIKDEFYTVLVKEATPSKLFKSLLENVPDVPESIKTFTRFACYFKGFQENRKNIYSVEAQQTAAAYRAVNDNFTKFLSAIKIFSSFNQYPGLLCDIRKRTSDLLSGNAIEDVFKVEAYNQFLPQSGIDLLNNIIGEVNYAINQYRQQHKEIKPKELPFMPVLYKQILSDREQAFIVRAFENDSELCSALAKFCEIRRRSEINGNPVELFSSLQKELAALTDEGDLYVDAKALEKISIKTTGSWERLQEAMFAYATMEFKTKKEQEKYCNRAVFKLDEIKSWKICRTLDDGTLQAVDVTAYWKGEYASKLFETERNLAPVFEKLVSQEHENLRADKEKVRVIKEYLDAVQEIFHLVKPLVVSPEYGGDLNLLGILTAYYTKLESIIPLYNQTRNYVTKKLTDVGKIKLMFNRPTLADGWDNNKEKANLTVLFAKNEQYYWGIIAPNSQVDFDDYIASSSENNFQKMVYKLLPGPNKMLPKVFFSKKNIDFFSPDPKLLERYQNGEHLKGDKFDLAFCHELIDFFKKSILKHEDWSKFGFCFSPTSSYKGIDDFYREVTEQGYILNFVSMSEEKITQLVDEGKLYLFQIWNKDFSAAAKGTPNKFTLYWKQLFSQENLADVVLKLNGEAELFLRKQAIKEPVVHAKGEKLVNRTVVVDVKDDKAVRQTIPENIYHEIFLYANGKVAETDLSKETRHYLIDYPLFTWKKGMAIANAVDKVIVKEAAFDIIKDKRYTEDKYSFHVPVTINFKSPSKPVKFNDKVLNYLENNPDVKIIGLDRGERNLIYLTLIDQQGKILKQKSLNVVNGVNYHEKLDSREKERVNARKSWQEIGQIKDFKAGYLSGAVYEIAKMMVEENAIVVMENLNFGFKRGRMKIEKQIYQNFERALIEKLNYLVFKKVENFKAPGGVLAGFQLADKFESFAKLGSQCGFIFYVPASFTSKIDPATGFVNIFNLKECTGAESIKEFFDNFDSIRYSAAHDAFEFKFDYSNFKTHQKDYKNKWSVFSIADAWQQKRDKDSGKFSAVMCHPTAEIKAALLKTGIEVVDGLDLLEVLRSMKAVKATAFFFEAVFYAFKLSVALRHTSKDEDKIVSPVMNSRGEFYVSGKNPELPKDADANGAFHIALKGLYLLKNKIKGGKLGKMTHEEWIKFAQTRNEK